MDKKYSWLKFIPLYGGIIVLLLLMIKSAKGEISKSLIWKLMVKSALCFAVPFYIVILFLALSKTLLSFSPSVIIVCVFGASIALGFLFNKFVFYESSKNTKE